MSSRPPSELDALSLRPQLRKLLEASKPPTIQQVWRALSREEKARALWLLLANPAHHQTFFGRIVLAVERTLRIRRQTLVKKPLGELAYDAANADASGLPVEPALRELHLRDRLTLLAAFLDAAGVPHLDGLVEAESIAPSGLTPDRVAAAVDAVAGQFSPDDVAIYLLTLLAIEPRDWEAVEAWRSLGALQLATAPRVPGFPLFGPPTNPVREPGRDRGDMEKDGREDAKEHYDGLGTGKASEHDTPESDEMIQHAKSPVAPLKAEGSAIAAGSVELPAERLKALRMEFDRLAATLRSAADGLAAGKAPHPSLAGIVGSARAGFERARNDVLASLLAPGSDADPEIEDIETLSVMLESDLAERDRRGRAAAMEPARDILAAARRVDGPSALSAALSNVWHAADRLLRALADAEVDDTTRVELQEVVAGTHALAALVGLVRDEGALGIDEVGALTAIVRGRFGEPLAVAAMRGKLGFADQPPPPLAPAAEVFTIRETDTTATPPGAPVTPPSHPATEEQVAEDVQDASLEADSASVEQLDKPNVPASSAPPELAADHKPPPAARSTAEGHGAAVGQPMLGSTKAPAPVNRHERSAWRELGGSEPTLAFFHAVLAERQSRPALPSRLVRTVCLAPFVRDSLSPVSELVAGDLAALDLSQLLSVEDDELQQALRLLVVAGALRPSLLNPASAAPTQLESLRHDSGFAKLWELCTQVVTFARGGLALGPDVLSMVSTKAAWADRVKTVQQEARSWLVQKAPAYRFQFAGATNVWRKMLERGNLLDAIVRPAAENTGAALADVQKRINDLSSVAEIHRQVQRIDRDEVGRPRGGDIHAGALRQLENGILEGVEIARRWVQLHRVNPTGEEGWRLEQAGKLRAALLSLRGDVDAELRAARERASTASTPYMADAVARCASAIEDLCGLFEGDADLRKADRSPDELLAMPLLLRAAAPIAPDGTVDISQEDALTEALSEAPEADLRSRWSAAFDGRLARLDFSGTQLLLDRAELLGYDLDERDRERLQERRDAALAARRSSLGYEVDKTRRSIAEGAARGFLREQEHNNLLAEVTAAEVALANTIDFAALEGGLRGVQAKLGSLRQAAVAEVRGRLQEAEDISPEMAQKVAQLLDQADILTATEVLQNRIQWDDARRGEVEGAAQFRHFLAFLRRTADSSPNAPSGDLAELPPVDGAPDSPDHLTADANTVLGTWIDRRVNVVDTGLTKRVFGLLGFTVEGVDQVGGSGPRWQEVTTLSVRDRSRCPVPFFGSRANGHYRVLWLWGPTSPEDVVSAVTDKEGSRDEAVIVFYFGRLDESQRRALRLESLQKRTRFLVLDDVLLAYLARLKGARMSAFFACALPFTNLVPYHTIAGEVPPEMFYGRHQQRSEIQDQDGTSLVFGGRQLGKTALLRDVQGTFHNRAEGRVAIYADLKAAGVGVHRDANAVWEVVADELRRAQIAVPDSDSRRGAAPAHEAVEKAVQAWIAKSPRTNRVLLLLDEADLFFKQDGEAKNFANAHLFKTLMDRTQRAFKVVFAGLHNVQRSTRIANHPLAHMGVPVCVGPMVEGAEWQAAVDLVERPLAAMGYEIDRDLTIRILSHTNYYPSLIQIYCGELLKHVNQSVNRWSAERGPLPATIATAQVEEAYRSFELRQRIKQSFDLTLNLDPRYKVIALCVADATAAREPWVHTPKDIGVGELREAVMQTWGDGFRADRSEEGFRALLEEMVGLGVLRRSSEGRYALRGANVPLLLGSELEVVEKLISLDPPETYETFEPDTYRRPLPDLGGGAARGGGRASLTVGQEFELYAPTNGVAVICGVAAAGLRDVMRCLNTGERAGKPVTVQDLPADATEATFEEVLRATVRKGAVGTTLLVVPDAAAWSEKWLHRAHESLRSRGSKDRFIRVVFVAGPERTWALLRDHGGDAQTFESLRKIGVTIHSLRPWRAAVVRHWLEEQQLSTTNPAFRLQEVDARTGYWPRVLVEYVEAARGKAKGQVVDPGPDFLAGLFAGEAADRWRGEFGLTVPEPSAALHKLSRLALEVGGPITVDELSVLGELDEQLARRAVAWADTLGLVDLEVRKSGPAAWILDDRVARLARAFVPGLAAPAGTTEPTTGYRG